MFDPYLVMYRQLCSNKWCMSIFVQGMPKIYIFYPSGVNEYALNTTRQLSPYWLHLPSTYGKEDKSEGFDSCDRPSNLKLDSNRQFFRPCDLEIRWMTLENNRAPLLCYVKLCAAFRSHCWIQTGVTIRKRVDSDNHEGCALKATYRILEVNQLKHDNKQQLHGTYCQFSAWHMLIW